MRPTKELPTAMATPLTVPSPLEPEAREALFVNFKALVTELEQDQTTDKNLLSLCKALFAFTFGEA